MKQASLEAIIRQHATAMEPLPAGVDPRPDRLEGIRAVLFDVYGTLLISGSGDVGTAAAVNTAAALGQALQAAGFQGDLPAAGEAGIGLLQATIRTAHETARAAGTDYPEVEILEIWQTVIARLTAERLLRSGGDEDALRALALEYECRVNPTAPMPGAIETLTLLRKRGLILGIVSNAQFYTPLLFPALLGASVEDLGFDPGCCIWSYRERKAKPSADLFPNAGRFLAERYGIGLHNTVYVGNDLLNDVWCAGAAGCRTVLFAGDRRSLRLRENDQRCLAVRPDAVITSLTQLPEILSC